MSRWEDTTRNVTTRNDPGRSDPGADRPATPQSDIDSRLNERVAELLRDAESAQSAGSTKAMHALCNAVLALDPDNAQAKGMLRGFAVRRQMTLMFCDIVGSTEMADSRDPEEVTALLRLYRSACEDVIKRFDGWVDDHRGDGMLVLFGYPDVRESDARRGVLCGLKIIEELRRRLPASGLDLARDLRVRISVHTDLVVVGDAGITGATSNEAARLQELAAGNTVVISDATHALVAPFFDCESLGLVQLRGVSRPLEAFTVRREAFPHRSVSPLDTSSFVGRRPELAQIGVIWRRTQQQGAIEDPEATRRPLTLLVTGAPGMGKTRLVSEAARELAVPNVQCSCSQLHQNTSLHAFRALLEAACGIVDTDSPEQRLQQLRARLPEDTHPAGDLRFLAAALDIPLAMLGASVDVEATVLRRHGLAAAAGLVLSVLPPGPSMLFVDDVHWADQSTLDLLEVLLAWPRRDLVVVLTARDGMEVPATLDVAHRLSLEPLDADSVAQMAVSSPEGALLSEEQRVELGHRSDGVPLFLEELLRTAAVTESGRHAQRSMRYSDYKIPQSLRDPLLARLSLPQVDLDLAQAAATIGRDFDEALLRRMVGGDAWSFSTRLGTLFDAELLESTGAQIRFRHELIREIAYETQPHSTRMARHSVIADDLLSSDLDGSVQRTSELAFHLEHANRFGEAIDVHLRVAQSDQAVGSHVQACRRLTDVLPLVERLPPGAAQRQAELAVRQLRSFSAVMAGGYAAPEAAEDYPRCVQLCQQTRAATDVVASLIRTWSFYAFRGDLDAADQVADLAVQHLATAELSFPAHAMAGGVVGFFRGHYSEARDLLGSFAGDLSVASPERPPAVWPLPNDPLAAVQAHLGATAWVAGDGGASEAWFLRARHRSDSLEFPYGPFSRCYVDCLLALVRNLQGDPLASSRLGQEVAQVAERHGFAMWQLAGGIHRLIGLVHSGECSLLPQLVGFVDVWRTQLGADVWTPYWLTEIGRAQSAVGDDAAALRSFGEALTVAAATGSAFYTAETLRQRGCLRLSLGDPDGESELRAAAALAAEQGATLFSDRVRRSQAARVPT